MSKKTLIIGAGGVGNVVAFKCAMNAETFGDDHACKSYCK